MNDADRAQILRRLTTRYAAAGPDHVTRVLDDTTQTLETLYQRKPVPRGTIERLARLRLDTQR